MESKVSIILPCYNSALFIKRYFDALLKQTYKNIELITVNDGSTDNTEAIIESYRNKFTDAGIELVYIYQNNKGLPGSINTGLEVFTGEFLTWGDPDDYLSPTSIEKRVNFLVENSDYGFVHTNARKFDHNDPSVTLGHLVGSKKNNILNELILEKKAICTPGCYLVRSSSFREAIPNCRIYDKARGQNWQLLIPIALNCKSGYISEDLNNYAIRPGSMSRDDDSMDKELIRCDEHQDILFNVVLKLNIDEEKYKALIIDKYNKKKLLISYVYNNKTAAYIYYKKIIRKDLKDIIIFIRINSKIIDMILEAISNIRGAVTK